MSMDEEFNQFIRRPAGPESDLRTHLDQVEREVNILRESLQRNRAEHQNYKRRMEQAESRRAGQAAAGLVSRLLPVLDDLDRAAGVGPDAHRPSVGSTQDRVWKEGMEMIRDKLMSVLEKEGLRRIEAAGQPFNPVLHEAVAPHPTDALPEDTVVTVQQHGYTLNGTLLRPAKVTVARRQGHAH